MPRKSLAENLNIPRGKANICVDGIKIHKANRVTCYVYRAGGLQDLLSILQRDYLAKRKHAVIYGINTRKAGHRFKYAIYTQVVPTKKQLREELREAKEVFEETGFDGEEIELLREMIAEPRRKPSAPKVGAE